MKKFLSLSVFVLILPLIASCSNATISPSSLSQNQEIHSIEEPDIAFDKYNAVYIIRENEHGVYLPSYSSRICAKSFLGTCSKWELKIQFFESPWFLMNDFTLSKRPRPVRL